MLACKETFYGTNMNTKIGCFLDLQEVIMTIKKHHMFEVIKQRNGGF